MVTLPFLTLTPIPEPLFYGRGSRGQVICPKNRSFVCLVCNELFEPLPFQLTFGKVFAMVSLRKKYIKVVGAPLGRIGNEVKIFSGPTTVMGSFIRIATGVISGKA